MGKVQINRSKCEFMRKCSRMLPRKTLLEIILYLRKIAVQLVAMYVHVDVHASKCLSRASLNAISNAQRKLFLVCSLQEQPKKIHHVHSYAGADTANYISSRVQAMKEHVLKLLESFLMKRREKKKLKSFLEIVKKRAHCSYIFACFLSFFSSITEFCFTSGKFSKT